MFEAQVAYYLNLFLGKYVTGLDAESLKISVWKGDVELRNLQLKPEALQELNLPITVKSGLLGRLTLRVPWAKLGQVPVVIEFDKLYIVACPREEDEDTCSTQGGDDLEAAATKYEQDSKRKRVQAAEQEWIKEIQAKEQAGAGGGGGDQGRKGHLAGWIDTILGNLELHITNVHIRYEDPVTNPQHKFTIGVMLQEISAHTVDEAGKKMFVTSNAMTLLRKGVTLRSLCIYFDCDAPLLMDQKKNLTLLDTLEWDQLLLPDKHVRSSNHQYLLSPVDGTMRYTRRKASARVAETDAQQEVELQLQNISIGLHQMQYSSGRKLLETFDMYQATAPHRHLRPHCRPSSGVGARLWWRYAIRAVQRQQQHSNIVWRLVKMVSQLRKKYVPAYVRLLQQGKVGGDENIAQMDEQLDEHVIRLFRRMAYAKFIADKRKAAQSGGASAHQVQHQQGGGWLSWLRGQKTSQSAEQDAGAVIATDDWSKLEDMVAQQEAELSEPTATPYTIQMRFIVHVGMGAVELRNGSGDLLMQGSLTGVDAAMVTYPQTTDINLDIGTFGVTSAHGPLLSSGLLSGSTDQGSAAARSSAISAQVIKNPQDGKADVVVRLAVAPSYVTYNNNAIQDVVGFFKADSPMELSRLQAQAAARTDKVTRMAQLQLKALSNRNAEQKPRLLLSVTMHAPKVAIPDATGSTTLVADLGCFTIKSNPELLSAEEAAVYECFVARIDHVSAYLLDGTIVWPASGEGWAAATVEGVTKTSWNAVFLQEYLEKSSRVVPLLERFGVGMDVYASTSVHPRYPVCRLALNASPLRLQFSPWRYQHLMTVLNSISPAPPGQQQGPSAQAPDQPLWLTDSEYSAPVAVLSWEGMTSTVAKWHQHRWVHVWRGRVYITHHQHEKDYLLCKEYWRGYYVAFVPPESVGGAENVVGIIPNGVKRDAAAENPDALLMKPKDAATAAELRKRLVMSASQMANVAGLLQVGDNGDADADVGTTKDVFDEILSHQVLLDLSGHISEASLLLSGRPPVHWWPPEGLTAGGSTQLAGMDSVSSVTSTGGARPLPPPSSRESSESDEEHSVGLTVDDLGADLVSLSQEVELIDVRFQGARVHLITSGDVFKVDVVMKSLTVKDNLVGAKNPDKAYMARSYVSMEEEEATAADTDQVRGSTEDEFYDAVEAPESPRSSSGFLSVKDVPGSLSRLGSSDRTGSGTLSKAARPGSSTGGAIDTDLVRLYFARHNPQSSKYKGVDTEAALRMGSLVFYCSRPTVAALMVLGSDMGAINTLMAAAAVAAGGAGQTTVANAAAASQDVSESSDSESVTDTQLVLTGGEQRTIFKMELEVSKVELHMNYEGSTPQPLMIGSIDNFLFGLSVHPATLKLNTSLGNVVALYGVLPEDHPNRTLLTVREGVKDSLVKVEFKIHSVEESFHEERVPGGMRYYSVVAKLSTVQVVFMKRFLNEFLDYLSVMMAMQPKPLVLPAAAQSQQQQAAEPPAAAGEQQQQQQQQHSTASVQNQQAPATAEQQQQEQKEEKEDKEAADASSKPRPMILLLDVHLDAPVINLPLDSSSADHIEVDLGTLEVGNSVLWDIKGGAERQKVLLDDMKIKLYKVSGCVVASKQRGDNVIQDMGAGVLVAVRRPLLAEPGPMPPMTTAVMVPQLNASMTDVQYQLILAIIAANFSEPSDLPPEVLYLHQKLLQVQLAQPRRSTNELASTSSYAAPPAATAPEPRTRHDPMHDSAGSSNGEDDSDDDDDDGDPKKRATAHEEDIQAVLRKTATDFTVHNAALLSLIGDVCAARTTVGIARAQLKLWNGQDSGGDRTPLGSVEFADLWVAHNTTSAGNMLLTVSLPTVCVRDLRPGVPKEASLVLSTAEIGATAAAGSLAGTGAVGLPVAHTEGGDDEGDASSDAQVATTSGRETGAMVGGAAAEQGQGHHHYHLAGMLPSLLTLEYRSFKTLGPGPVQGIQLRLQRPTLVLDIGFIMTAVGFFVPDIGLQGPVPRPYETHELHLGAEPHVADSHIWLSPEYRIIADAPDVKHFVYDGNNNAIILPSLPPTDHVPLIVVGRDKTMQLKNVRVATRSALAACLLLGPGARLLAEESDGVQIVNTEEELKLSKKYKRLFMRGLSSRGQLPSPDASSTRANAAAAGTMEVNLTAVGAAVYLLDAHAAALNPSMQELPQTRSTGALSIRKSRSFSATEMDDGGAAAGGNQEEDLLRMLALYMDVGLKYQVEGLDQFCAAEIRGLTMKAQTHLLEDAQPDSPTASAHDKQTGSTAGGADPAGVSPRSQQTASSILEPCDITASYKLTSALQDVSMDVTDLRLRVSPDVMQLVLHLQQVVLEPLTVPPADKPLVRCDMFEKLWCSHPAESSSGPPYPTAGAGGVDVMSSEKGVTVWRPQAPMGYGIVGDVITAGCVRPDFQVVALAINSGFVTYPTSYQRVWESRDITIWRPVPPPGYVAMGCISSMTTTPPVTKAVVVVHQEAVVEALLQECMLLSPGGNWWCCQNNVGSFEVSPPDAHEPQVPLYDLRSPLGIAPAALHLLQPPDDSSAAAAAGVKGGAISAYRGLRLPPSLLAAKRFVSSRAKIRSKLASASQVTTAVEFSRIWWDKRAKHPSITRVSFWRPNPPPGYAALGDCMVTGMYAPPQEVWVIRDAEPGQEEEETTPLLKKPINYNLVWVDRHKAVRSDSHYLTIWKPVPPPGYVAMGLVATLGGQAPQLHQVRCVRNDMVTPVELKPSDPSMILLAHKQRAALAAWVLDERFHTFTVVVHDGTPQQLEGFKLKEVDPESGLTKTDQEADNDAPVVPTRALHVALKIGKTNVLVRNLLRTPVLELEATEIKTGVCREQNGVVRCFAFLTTSLWSYHSQLQTWEPVIEPWQLLLHFDMNAHTHSLGGVGPGTWFRFTSTQGCVHVTLAHAAISSVQDALTDWQHQSAQRKSGPQALAAVDGFTVQTICQNMLDTTAYVQLDFGSHKEVVMLPPHQPTAIRQPLPQPPQSHAPLEGGVPPPIRLLVDIMDAQLGECAALSGSALELYCEVEVSGRLAGLSQQSGWGMVTRAVSVLQRGPQLVVAVPGTTGNSTESEGSQNITWNERFMLMLPPALAEQLLCPAPGDNPFAGISLELKISVYDGSGRSGMGLLIGTATVPVEYNWLSAQVEALNQLRQAAAATDHAVPPNRSGFTYGKTHELTISSAEDSTASDSDASACMTLRAHVSVDDSQIDNTWYHHHLEMRRLIQAAAGRRRGLAWVQQRHALRLEGNDMWSPFSLSLLQRVPGVATPHTGVVPIRAAHGLVLEVSYKGGAHEMRLRSSCQFVNETDMVLEVSLLEEVDTSWTVVPATRGATANQASVGEVVEQDVFENERYVPLRGWSPNNLLLGDPKRYTWRLRDGYCSSHTFPSMQLPKGWEWEGPWEMEVSGNVDADGWSYAFDPSQLRYPPAVGSGVGRPADFVRRRRWVRKRRRVELPTSVLDIAPAASSGEEGVRHILGRVQPGDSIPLPHNWHQDNKQLQVRPVLRTASSSSGGGFGDDSSEHQEVPSHSWSYGASNGRQSVLLGSLEDGGTRLLCCKTLTDKDYNQATPSEAHAQSVASPRAAVTRAPGCWISTVVECHQLTLQAGLDAINDWRIVARPPLVVQNLLPVKAYYALYEKIQSTKQPVMRQQGEVPGGGSVNVYSVDVRQQVLMTFYPDGYKPDYEAVLISEGFLGSSSGITAAAAQKPLTTFPVNYENSISNTKLQLRLNRILDLELIESQRLRVAAARAGAAGSASAAVAAAGDAEQLRLSPSAALAQGRTLTLQVYVPVWVINGTPLPVTTGVVTLPAGQQDTALASVSSEDTSQSGGVSSSSQDSSTGLGYRVFDTDAYTQVMRPEVYVTIMPNSIELMSFPEQQEGRGLQWAAVLKIMNSQWSAPMLLQEVLPAGSGGGGTAVGGVTTPAARLPHFEPVLIRARSKPDNTLYEIVARIESAGSGVQRSLVLRLDSHIVVSNRTGYTLHLLQPETLWAASQQAAAAGGSSTAQRAWLASGATAAGNTPAGHTPLLSSTPSTTPAQGQQLTQQQAAAAAAVASADMVLRPGAIGVPVHWQAGVVQRLLALALPQSQAAAAAASGKGGAPRSSSWSEVFRIQYPACTQMQVLVPVYMIGSPDEHQPIDDATLARARREFQAMFPQNKQASAQADSQTIADSVISATAKAAGNSHDEYQYTGPSFVHMARQTADGLQHFLGVAAQLVVMVRSPGCLHVVLQSLGGEPQYELMNCTPSVLRYRQATPRASWQLLLAWSAAGFVPMQTRSSDGSVSCKPEVELRDASASTSGSVVCSLESAGAGAGAQPATEKGGEEGGIRQCVFPVRGGQEEALTQVIPLFEAVMGVAGPHELSDAGTASLGRSKTDSLLRVVPMTTHVNMSQLQIAAAVSGGVDQARASPSNSMHIALEVPALDVSLVDQAPKELLLLSVDGLSAEYHRGNSASILYERIFVRLNFAQVDNMLHGSPYPVLAFPLDRNVLDDASEDPLIYFMVVKEPGRYRGVLYNPTITGRIAAVRLAVAERLVWQLYDCYTSLLGINSPASTGVAGDDGADAGGGKGDVAAAQQVASADLPLQVDLLSFDDLHMRVSFRTDKSERPRFANQMVLLSLIGEALNFDELPLTIPGIELEHVREKRSFIIAQVVQRLQQQAIGIFFNVFRSYGLLGSISKLMAIGGNVVSTATGSAGPSSSSSGRDVVNVGEGFMEGSKMFGQSVLKGVTGMVTSPLEGAEQGGLFGFMTGVGKGLVGVPGSMVGGFLTAASKVTEGIDASYSKMRDTFIGAETRLSRRRLPRCIRGDHVLTPFDLHCAMGLALLYTSGAASLSAVVKGAATMFSAGPQKRLVDNYETHLTLPGGNVAIVTSSRLLMVDSEAFATFEMEVLSGKHVQIDEVPPGQVKWQLTWDQMLTAELAYHRQVPGAAPDGVIIHRKYRGDDDVLVYDVRCRAHTRQPQELHEAITCARAKYYLEPLREIRGWRVTPVLAAEQQRDQEMPDSMLSMDFKRVWVCNKPGARCITVWRPVGPPGYASLGDVVMPGREPPARPIRMYKDVSAQHQDAPGEGARLATPLGFQLIFRDSGGNHPVSIWRPIPPKGYVEVGYVVVPAIDEPQSNVVRCMRTDLVKPTSFYDSPVWHDISSDNMYWQCSIWQVDNAAATFIAVKSNNRPDQKMAVSPVY